MPSRSKSQHRLMARKCTTGKGPGPKQSVACEFMHADKGLVAKMPERASKKGGR